MNPANVAILSLLLSAMAATGITLALRPASDGPSPGAISGDELRTAIKRLEERQQKLEQSLAATPARADSTSSNQRTQVATLSDEEIAAALQKYIAAHGVPSAATDAAAAKPVDVAASFAELRAGKNSFWRNPDAWKRVFAAGKMDELIKLFEANAKANPNDPQAQFDLANSYLAYLQMDQSKAPVLSLKSDRALDATLELDENHWGARFTKAVSYSFWPDFLGKKKEAMAQFDRLVTQQESMPVEADQSQTYLYYGNMLDQSGQGEKAKAIWQKGLTRHPNDAELRKRLGL